MTHAADAETLRRLIAEARQATADARRAAGEVRRVGWLPLALAAIAGMSFAAIVAGLIYLSLQSGPCI